MLSPADNNIQTEEEYQASTNFFELTEGTCIEIYVSYFLVDPFWSYLTP